MAERLMKMPAIAKPQPAARLTVSVPSVSFLSHLKYEFAQLTEQVDSLQEPTATSSRSPPISNAQPVQQASYRLPPTAINWHHITLGVKASRCISLLLRLPVERMGQPEGQCDQYHWRLQLWSYPLRQRHSDWQKFLD
ncbi:unnamed protein product [Schistocephalus solidus]|uniref:Uncharacterized protein n=1 Tax=Schistocephalus solidus TaxID=70667 RepID=A0A183TNS3_SCHSO|nr:unnamed protein product [Schistocephalus solidus]